MLQPGTFQPPVQPRQSRAHSDHSRDREILSSPPFHILEAQMALHADSNCLCPAEHNSVKKAPILPGFPGIPQATAQASRKDIPEMRTWVEGEDWGRLGAQYHDNFSPRSTFLLAKNSHLPSLDSGDPSHKSPRAKAPSCNDLSLREKHPGELENLLVSF